jgi:hypothetical protein
MVEILKKMTGNFPVNFHVHSETNNAAARQNS